MVDITEMALKVADRTVPYTWLEEANRVRFLQFVAELQTELQKDAEPVGVVDESDDGLFADFETPNGVMVKRGDKLFLHPQPKAATVPLTPEEIEQCFMSRGHPAEHFHVAFLKDDIQGVAKALFRKASAAPSQSEEGRTNSGDETGGTVKRFGFDCTKNPPEIIPATNGAFVHYDDYVKLFKKTGSSSLPAAEDALDAARYRWLRDNKFIWTQAVGSNQMYVAIEFYWYKSEKNTREGLDEAIDSTMSQDSSKEPITK